MHKPIKKILFLSQILPFPLDAGPKIRLYYVLRYLAQLHEITLVSFMRSSDSLPSLNHLKSYIHQLFTVPISRSILRDSKAYFTSLINGLPFLITRDRSPAMLRLLDDLLGSDRFDVIHADQLWMAPYALHAFRTAEKQGNHPKLILDQHNAVFLIPRRMASNSHNPVKKSLLQREARLLESYEAAITTKFDQLIWVSGSDMAAIRSAQIRKKIENPFEKNIILPICIDPSNYSIHHDNKQSHQLLFIGGLHWPPNSEAVRWFVHKVLPSLRQCLPDVELLVVGRDPPADLSNIPNLKLTGYIADTREIWASSRLFIVPIQSGGGMRVKIIEAWAHGIPVVSTTIGAEGICTHLGENILLADSPSDFLTAVIRLLDDDSLVNHMADAGRRTVETYYDWRTVYKHLDSVYA